MHEWEEEQVKLDRDWYTGAEDGVLAGDEEHNPLAQYEDLNMLKQVEVAVKQTVSELHQSDVIFIHNILWKKKISAKQAQYVSSICWASICL
jgi:pre-mRNA-splicing factor ATP-dependent RNA helicase DHX38/PRP16